MQVTPGPFELIIFVIQKAFYPLVLAIFFLASSAYIFNQFIILVVGDSWKYFCSLDAQLLRSTRNFDLNPSRYCHFRFHRFSPIFTLSLLIGATLIYRIYYNSARIINIHFLFSGTSMATPRVGNRLIRIRLQEPTLTAAKAKQILLEHESRTIEKLINYSNQGRVMMNNTSLTKILFTSSIDRATCKRIYFSN